MKSKLTHFLILSAGMAMSQKLNDASPPDMKVDNPSLILFGRVVGHEVSIFPFNIAKNVFTVHTSYGVLDNPLNPRISILCEE